VLSTSPGIAMIDLAFYIVGLRNKITCALIGQIRTLPDRPR
jgi:hypothetical protein